VEFRVTGVKMKNTAHLMQQSAMTFWAFFSG